jgi:hypothetical protein
LTPFYYTLLRLHLLHAHFDDDDEDEEEDGSSVILLVVYHHHHQQQQYNQPKTPLLLH